MVRMSVPRKIVVIVYHYAVMSLSMQIFSALSPIKVDSAYLGKASECAIKLDYAWLGKVSGGCAATRTGGGAQCCYWHGDMVVDFSLRV